MSDRIVLCATAAQAAEFCKAEKQLLAESAAKTAAESEPSSSAADSTRKSVFDRLGDRPGEGGHQRPLQGTHDGRRHQGGKGRGRHQGGQGGRGDGHSSNRNESSCQFVFFRGHALVGDSLLVRMAKASGSYVDKRNNTCYGGATTGELLERIQKQRCDFPRKVILLAGTNDLINGSNKYDVLENINKIHQILRSKGTHVSVLTLPPFHIDRPETSALRFLNGGIKALRSQGSTIIDIYMSFKSYQGPLADLYERRYLNGKKDLVHPNSQGLKIMMEEILRPTKPYGSHTDKNLNKNNDNQHSYVQNNTHQRFKLKLD